MRQFLRSSRAVSTGMVGTRWTASTPATTSTPGSSSSSSSSSGTEPPVSPFGDTARKPIRVTKPGEHHLAKWRTPTDEGNQAVSKDYNGFLRFTDMMRDLAKDMTLPMWCAASYFGLPLAGLVGWEHLAASCLIGAAVNRCTMVHGIPNTATKDLTGKQVLVVGSSALAVQTAVGLAKMGATVRVAGAAEHKDATAKMIEAASLGGGSISYVDVDISDPHSIRTMTQQYTSSVKQLDILVNCYLSSFPFLETTKSGEEMSLALNFLGPYFLTEKLLPLLSKSKGRVVYTSSRNHQAIIKQEVMRELIHTKPLDEDYSSFKYFAASCLGNIYHTEAIAKDKKNGVQSAVVNIGTVAMGEITPKYESSGVLSKLMAKTASEASQSIVNAAVRGDLRSGGYYSDCKHRRQGKSRIACDSAVAKEVLDWAAQRTTKKFQ